MAIATTTALAIGGLAVSAGSTVMSFSQASKQQKLQRQAEEKAAASMAEARKKLEVNFAKERSIKKEPYELAREAMLSQGAQSIQAGVESDRGAETTAGKVQMAQNVGQGQIRSSMGEELTDIEKDIVNEDSRLRDLGVQLDLGEVEGQQLIAKEAAENAAAANMEGFQRAASTLQQGLAMIPLYQQNNAAQKAALGKMSLSNEEIQKIGNVKGKPINTADIANMSKKDFRQFKRELTPQQKQLLYGNAQFQQNYNPFNPF